MESMSHHITLLIINSLGGRHAHKHTHTHTHTHTHAHKHTHTHTHTHTCIQTIRTGSILRNQARWPVAGTPGLKI